MMTFKYSKYMNKMIRITTHHTNGGQNAKTQNKQSRNHLPLLLHSIKITPLLI